MGRFRPLKKFGKFGIFSKLSKLSNFPRSTMWKWTSTSRSVLVHFHIVESGKLESLENTPLLLQPWYTVLSRLQQVKTRIGQLNLCRMKLPYSQRQQERASRVRRDHKLALRTAFAALILVTTRVVSDTRAVLLERSRGQVRGQVQEGRDFLAKISHEEAHLQEASRSS